MLHDPSCCEGYHSYSSVIAVIAMLRGKKHNGEQKGAKEASFSAQRFLFLSNVLTTGPHRPGEICLY